MYPRPTAIRHLGQHKLHVKFQDGVAAELDFTPMIQWGGVFDTLRDPATFSRARIDAEAETIVWPGDIDICPDVLYHLATGSPLPGDLPKRAANVIKLERTTSAA
jgi:hypothetical protein